MKDFKGLAFLESIRDCRLEEMSFNTNSAIVFSKELTDLFKKIKKDVKFLEVHVFKIDENIDYLILSFFRDGFLEVHFHHYNKKLKRVISFAETKTNSSAQEIFSAVITHVLKRVKKDNPAAIKIIGEEKRYILYKKIADYVVKKYLKSFVVTDTNEFLEEIDSRGNKLKLKSFTLESKNTIETSQLFDKLGVFDILENK